MKGMKDEKLQHIRELLSQAEDVSKTNQKHPVLKVVIFISILAFLLLSLWLDGFEPVSAVTVNQIDELAKSAAACQNRGTASYKAEIKRMFNIYDFDHIDKNTAATIIKYLKQQQCPV